MPKLFRDRSTAVPVRNKNVLLTCSDASGHTVHVSMVSATEYSDGRVRVPQVTMDAFHAEAFKRNPRMIGKRLRWN